MHFRTIKELHYFDALEAGRIDREIARHQRRREELANAIARDPDGDIAGRMRLLHDRTEWIDVLERGGGTSAYLDYLDAGRGAAWVVGEATPAYALLPEERLAEIAAMSRDVRIVYLMREPVARLWSHVRMIARRRAGPDGDLSRATARVLARTFSGEETEIVRRSDYAGALARLTAAVPRDRLFLGLTEEIAVDLWPRVGVFLGLGPSPAPEGPANEGVEVEMTEAQAAAAREWLAPQYAAAERFVEKSREFWPRN